ncbi:hypothetical protein ACWCO0_21610 [Streptomyces tubercidicus]|uniref:Uncharacterized protein n=1 Tax=Streptomyces tubercidicus TaxID=47759 RepID=A0A640UJ02_9ACTN|nr:hypothetical protein [Streptomyces tubercidicus]WAU10860.1 hypothetical protein STRTU_000989 [Streptomyces tubercidicus]GFE36033.1 hypothetical protein Stube_07060 [Streptomyces tubercidicus]
MTQPPPRTYWCHRGYDGPGVKQEYASHVYARGAGITPQLWDDRGTGAHSGVAVWGLDAPPASVTDRTERRFLPAQYTTTVNHYNVADPTPTSWVLEVPADVETHEVPGPPRMTSTAKPEAPAPVTDRIVRVPLTP